MAIGAALGAGQAVRDRCPAMPADKLRFKPQTNLMSKRMLREPNALEFSQATSLSVSASRNSSSNSSVNDFLMHLCKSIFLNN